MQTPFPTTASARACTAPQQHSFRLPLASCCYSGQGIEGKSEDDRYRLSIYPTHGVEQHKTQFWAFEERTDELGRQWHCTTAAFTVEDFGDLVEVSA